MKDDIDPIDQLESTHRRILERLDELVRGAADDGVVSDTLRFIDRGVKRHEVDEEESLFPRLAGVASLKDAVAKLEEEHRAHQKLHEALRDAGTVEERRAIAGELVASYRRHIELEEREVFPAARTAIDAEGRRAMGEEIDARRGRG